MADTGSDDRIMLKDNCLTVKELADHLHVDQKTIRRMERSGVLPGMRFGSCLRFDPVDVAEFKKGMRTIHKRKRGKSV